jgi:hypothetical protein
MAKKFRAAVLAAAVLGLWAFAPTAQAGPMTHTISIKFGADEPNGSGFSMMLPTDLAGVPGVDTRNWNNAVGASGTIGPGGTGFLVRDDFGIATITGTTVTWQATNTWSSTGRGEENNNFLMGSADRKLMAGYLDENVSPGSISITISNVPKDFDTYDVYLYFLGGVAGRFGDYTVDGNTIHNVHVGGAGFNGPAFVQAVGDDSTGNFLLFPGLSGFTITIGVTETGAGVRAPINDIEIVGHLATPTQGGEEVPEPTSFALLGVGILGLLAWKRRRGPWRKRFPAFSAR